MKTLSIIQKLIDVGTLNDAIISAKIRRPCISSEGINYEVIIMSVINQNVLRKQLRSLRLPELG